MFWEHWVTLLLGTGRKDLTLETPNSVFDLLLLHSVAWWLLRGLTSCKKGKQNSLSIWHCSQLLWSVLTSSSPSLNTQVGVSLLSSHEKMNKRQWRGEAECLMSYRPTGWFSLGPLWYHKSARRRSQWIECQNLGSPHQLELYEVLGLRKSNWTTPTIFKQFYNSTLSPWACHLIFLPLDLIGLLLNTSFECLQDKHCSRCSAYSRERKRAPSLLWRSFCGSELKFLHSNSLWLRSSRSSILGNCMLLFS